MALDAVVFPQDPFGNNNCSFKDYFQGMEEDEIICDTIGGFIDTQYSWSYDQLNSCIKDQWEEPNSHSSPEVFHGVVHQIPIEEEQEKDQPVTTRRKRRRTKMNKNKEEVENQRMTHIAVERNRRKQMNEYLAVLLSLVPSSYAQRGDQASIIGGAINFVKELEQLLQTLEAEKTTKNNHHQQQLQAGDDQPQQDSLSNLVSPFANFLTLPQYTTSQTTGPTSSCTSDDHKVAEDGNGLAAAAADIEVTVVESHANVKILVKKRSKQLVKIVNAFQNLKLTVQHLNVSSLDHMVLYSTSVKIEDGCKFNSVDEIAAAVNQMLHNIEEDRVCADEFSYNM